MTTRGTKSVRYLILVAAFAIGAACGKKADDEAAADAGDAAAPVAEVDAGATSEIASYPTQIPQSGTKLTKVPFTIHKAADASSPVVARVGPNTLINLKASFSSWMLIEYPSGVGQLSPGWINLDIKDRTKVADSAPIDAGKDAAVDAAPEAAAPVDAAANDARTIRPIIKIKPKK
jgi:hypothetical protein